MDVIHIQYSRDVIEEIPKGFHGPLEEGHAFARTKHAYGKDYLMFKDNENVFITREHLNELIQSDIEKFKFCQLSLYTIERKEMMSYENRTEEIVCIEYFIHIAGILNLIFGKDVGISIYRAICKRNDEKWIDYKEMKTFVLNIIKKLKFYNIDIEEEMACEITDTFFKTNQLPKCIKNKIRQEKDHNARQSIRKHFDQIFQEIYLFKKNQYDPSIDFDPEKLREILHNVTDSYIDHIKKNSEPQQQLIDDDGQYEDYVSRIYPPSFFQNEVKQYFKSKEGDFYNKFGKRRYF